MVDKIINEINFGWARIPLQEQLKGLKFKYKDDTTMAEMDAEAVMRLHIRGMITDKMRDHAIRNIVKRLQQRLTSQAGNRVGLIVQTRQQSKS